MRSPLRSLLLLVPFGVTLAGMVSCSAPSKGALVLAISTDMQAPKDINLVSVFITSDSEVKFDYLGRVLPDGSVALPATLAIVEPDNPNAQIRIRVTAFQDQNARVLRDVQTTVPHGRTSLLRLPLSLLDDGDVTGTLPARYLPGTSPGGLVVPDGDTTYSPIDEPGAVLEPHCSFTDNKTSVNGACVSSTVDSTMLPDYTQEAVYGPGGLQPNGAPVTCFDVQTCFASAMPVAGLSLSQCTFPLPAGANPATYNLALATPTTGACVGPNCFVPLVNDVKDGSWSIVNGTVHLLPGVCVKMMTMGAALYQAEGTCPAQTLSDPVCEPVNGQVDDAGAAKDASDIADSGAVSSGDASTSFDSGIRCAGEEVLCKGICVSAADGCGGGTPDAAAPVDATAGGDAGAPDDAGAPVDAALSPDAP